MLTFLRVPAASGAYVVTALCHQRNGHAAITSETATRLITSASVAWLLRYATLCRLDTPARAGR